MKKILLLPLFVILCFSLQAEPEAYPVAKVNFSDYKQLVEQVEKHRADRLIDFDTFLEMSRKPGVIVLDSRSKFRFDRLHLKGAVHLNFSDYTQDSLTDVIPDPETVVLIYCNNNFEGNQVDFRSKVAFPTVNDSAAIREQISAQDRPLMLALNVPTYLNLYGYGYRNVYELHELVDVEDPRVEFAGSQVVRDLSSEE